MKNLTIAHRIMLTIGAAVVSLLLVGFVGLYVSNTQTENIRLIDQDSLAGISTLSEARQAFMMIRLSVTNHIGSSDPVTKKTAEDRIELNEKVARKRFDDYEKLVSSDEEKKLLESDRQSMTFKTSLRLFMKQRNSFTDSNSTANRSPKSLA
jgi:hypothetical protein